MTARAALILTLLTLVSAACGSDSDPGSGVTVTATTGILADITERVAGEDAEVEQLIPDSASPHDFSLSAQDRAEVEDSALLVTNGSGLEAGIPIDEIDVPTYALSDHVSELLPFEEAGEHAREDGAEAHTGSEEPVEEEHGGEDPHVWMDPTRVAAALRPLANALADADPDHTGAYKRRAAAYAEELMALDEEIASALDSIPPQGRELVTSHDALGYFADRYGLPVVATPFPASGPEAEASAQSVQEVEDAIQRTGVPAVFAEESDDPQVLEQIAERTGVEIVGGLLVESPGEAGSYAEMLRRDAELIADGLTPTGSEQG